jgi:hypothetical protein
MPAVHSDFAVSDFILYIEVAGLTPATAEKVEDKWGTMILEMNRCIANWQKSGQGECGIDDADNEHDREFGRLDNRNQHALASRQKFFTDRQLYLLYLWEMLQRHDLLGLALQRLNNSVSSANGSSGVPSVVRQNNNNDDDDSLSNKTSPPSAGGNSAIVSLGKSIEKHGQTLVDIAKIDAEEKEKDRLEKEKERNHNKQAQLAETLRKLKGEKRSLLIQYAEEVEKGKKAVADAIMAQVDDIAEDIDATNQKIEEFEQTLKKRNRNTPPETRDD